MIARWSGAVEAGSETDHISAQWDVLPTVADIDESENVAGEHPEIVERMQKLFSEARTAPEGDELFAPAKPKKK